MIQLSGYSYAFLYEESLKSLLPSDIVLLTIVIIYDNI